MHQRSGFYRAEIDGVEVKACNVGYEIRHGTDNDYVMEMESFEEVEAKIRRTALSENWTKCPIVAGFAIPGFPRTSAMLATASVGDKPTSGAFQLKVSRVLGEGRNAFIL